MLTESRQVPGTIAGLLVASYWSSIVVGRVLFGFVVDELGIDHLLRLSMTATLIGAAMITSSPAHALTAVGLILAGLGLTPIFPCLMTRTPERLGRSLSAHAIGIQVSAATLGATVFHSLTGALAQYQGLEAIPAVALLMALVIFCLHEASLRRYSSPQPGGPEVG